MRASLTTVLLAWSVLAGFGLAFAQLSQLRGAIPPVIADVPAHLVGWNPHLAVVTAYTDIVTWSYWVFAAAIVISALATWGGSAPLWLVMLRRARREQRQRDVTRLLMPVLVPLCYLALASVTAMHVNSRYGVGLWWLLACQLAGFAAAIALATGPGQVLRSMKPRGLAVRLASRSAALGLASMIVAVLACGTAAITMHLYDHLTRCEFTWLSPAVSAHATASELFRGTALLVVYLVLVATALQN
jgi:hypothetical protein